MWDWLNQHAEWLAILGISSAVMLVGSALAVPWLVLRLPVDALRRPNPLNAWGRHHPVLRLLVMITRNAIGLPLLVVGIILALPLVPGQGLLTILLALIIMEFPGKWKLEHYLVSRPFVFRLLNWIRRKGHKEELLPPREREGRAAGRGDADGRR